MKRWQRILLFGFIAFSSMTAPVLLGLWALGGSSSSGERTAPALPQLAAWVESHPVPVIIHYALILSFLFFVVWFVICSRIASWAAQYLPESQTEAVPLETLKEKILALSQAGSPIQIKEIKKNRIRIEWKYLDAKWANLLGAEVGGISKLECITLDFDKKHSWIRAIDGEQTVTWNVFIEGGVVEASVSYRMFHGISFFKYDGGSMVCVQLKNGRVVLDKAYEYFFNLSELRDPVVKVALDSGWRYRPVFSFLRIFG